MSFAKELARALILAQMKERRIEQEKRMMGFPGRTITRRLPPPQQILPPPRIPAAPQIPQLRVQMQPQQIQQQQRPLPRSLPIPSPSANLQAPMPEGTLRREEEDEYSHNLSGYTKINIPSPEGIDVPVPEKMIKMDDLQDSPLQNPAQKIQIQPPPLPEEAHMPENVRRVQAQKTQMPQMIQMQRIQRKMQAPIPVPQASGGEGIDFGSISDLVKDPYIKAIEFSEGKMKIKTDRGEKEQGTLSEEEARQILDRVAKASGVEVQPAFEVRVGNLKLEAVISEVLGIRFIIEKV